MIETYTKPMVMTPVTLACLYINMSCTVLMNQYTDMLQILTKIFLGSVNKQINIQTKKQLMYTLTFCFSHWVSVPMTICQLSVAC